jgi:hypothetical protein
VKAPKDPSKSAQKWADQMANASASVTDGVMRMQEAPGIAAARNVDGYVAGVNANRGKWAQRVAAVPLGTIQQAMIQKGIPRMAEGASLAKGKVVAIQQALSTYQQAGLAQLNSQFPKTKANAKARAAWWIDYMGKFRKPTV